MVDRNKTVLRILKMLDEIDEGFWPASITICLTSGEELVFAVIGTKKGGVELRLFLVPEKKD